jgi:hypothetical protein
MAAKDGSLNPANANDFAEQTTDFLLREKYDSQTVFLMMGKSASNDLVAARYAEVVRHSAWLEESAFVKEKQLKDVTVKWFDAVDKILAPSSQRPPSTTPPQGTQTPQAPSPPTAAKEPPRSEGPR